MFKLRVYLAQAMTNKFCDEMIDEARGAITEFAKYGIEVWSPVIEEGVPYVHEKLTSINKEDLMVKWDVDKKEGLRTCHIMYIASGDSGSRGVGQERGHVRWYLWRPVVRKHEGPEYFSITDIEEDGALSTHRLAAAYVNKNWNSRSKWIAFKLHHILFGIPKLIWIQITSLWL